MANTKEVLTEAKLAKLLRDHRKNKAIRHGAHYACVCGEEVRSNSHFAQSEHQAKKILELLGSKNGDSDA